MRSDFVRCLYVMAWLSAGAPAQVAGWVQVATTGPSARHNHAMAFDNLRGKLVLFGGSGTSGSLADTWEWDGSLWTQVASTGPVPRYNHAMAYDSQRHRVVLFGGYGTTPYLGDTWEWDGTNWIPQLSASGPPARTQHAMAYDSQRHRVVLFGGYDGNQYLADTWEWDGTNWTQQPASGPPARNALAMAFDIGRARIVLFGGYSSGYLGDTWEWDGTSWIQRLASGPGARSDHAMAYDGLSVLLFGGWPSGDTWVWNGALWSQVTLPGPSARFGPAMAYDSLHDRTLLFGGAVAFAPPSLGDTWQWTRIDAATATIYGAGCGNPSLTFQPNPAARPIVGQVASATIVNPPTSVAAVALGLSNQFLGAFPLPVPLAAFGMPGCDLWQSAEFFGLGTSPLPPSSLEFSLPIPNVPGALGFRFYLQTYAFAPGQNPLSIIVSNGIEWRVGSL